jgi:hypothetical protein
MPVPRLWYGGADNFILEIHYLLLVGIVKRLAYIDY